MSIFKIERCKACSYKHTAPRPGKTNKPCPRCGATMYYLEQYYISYQIYGRKYVEAAGPQKRFAEDALSKRKSQIREGKFFDMKTSDITWNEGVEKLRKRYPYISENTQRMYETCIRTIESHGFTKLRWNQIDTDKINSYITDRQDKDITNSTINRELATFKRIAKLCKLYELFNEIELLPENDPRTMVITEAQEEALLQECQSPQLRLAILIALNTGLRKEGVYHMQWSDIDFKTKTISRVVKGNRKVYIPITQRLESALREYRPQAQLSQYVFPSPVNIGEPVHKTIHRSFHNACKRAGVAAGFRFHDLRHTFATNYLRITGDIHALQDILGHSEPRMTKRYAHILDDHKREAMKKFEEGRG